METTTPSQSVLNSFHHNVIPVKRLAMYLPTACTPHSNNLPILATCPLTLLPPHPTLLTHHPPFSPLLAFTILPVFGRHIIKEEVNILHQKRQSPHHSLCQQWASPMMLPPSHLKQQGRADLQSTLALLIQTQMSHPHPPHIWIPLLL